MKAKLSGLCCALVIELLVPSLRAANFIYSYDSLNRLTNALYSDGSIESYSLDPAGNRVLRITSSATVKVDTTPPSVPTNVITLALNNSQLLIGWSRAFDSGGSALAGYQVFVNGSLRANTTGTNYLLTNLLPDTQYCITVAAFDRSTNISAASLPVCVVTPSTNDTQPPLIVVLSPTNNAVFFTNLVSITGTATDTGRGANGIGNVWLNNIPANGGAASGTATSQWNIVVSLVPGYNPFRVIAQDASPNLNQTTNDFIIIRAIPSNEPPVVVASSMLPGNQFASTLAGNLGTTYGLWASTNLVDWMLLTNVTLTNWVQQLVDMDAPNYLQRFYRFSTSTNAPSTNAQVIADGLNSPSSLALDGDTIYFADNTDTNGIIKSVSKSGGPVTTLFTGATLYDAGAYRGPAALQALNSTIYGHYGGYVNMNIFSGPESGGSLTTLASISGGGFICVIGTNLYYGSGFSALNSMPVTGGTATPLASGYFIRNSTFDNDAIYFCDYSSRDVKKYTVSTGVLTTLVGGNPSEVGVFIDETNLYFNADGNIKMVPKAGGSVSTLVASSKASGNVSDGTRVYYVEDNAIKSVPIVGGVPSTLVTIPTNSLNSLVRDNSFIYWTDTSGGNGAGKIWRIAKPGP